MNVAENKSAVVDAPPRNAHGKYVTLALLLLWVAAVLAFTFLKFSGSAK